jgi:hypothetical protein
MAVLRNPGSPLSGQVLGGGAPGLLFTAINAPGGSGLDTSLPSPDAGTSSSPAVAPAPLVGSSTAAFSPLINDVAGSRLARVPHDAYLDAVDRVFRSPDVFEAF